MLTCLKKTDPNVEFAPNVYYYTSRDLFTKYYDVRRQYFLLSHGSIALACNVTLALTEKYGKKYNLDSWTHTFLC